MKRILPFLLLALCCACEKEEAVSLETLSGFLRSQKWTGASVRTNAQGEEIQRDSLTLYFVDTAWACPGCTYGIWTIIPGKSISIPTSNHSGTR